MRLVLVNNYSNNEKKTEATVQSLGQASGQQIELVDYQTPNLYKNITENPPDLLILSGSSHMLTKPENKLRFEQEIRIIRDSKFPILGICYGHQMIGAAFGVSIIDLGRSHTGYQKVKLLRDHPIFQGLTGEVRVSESHRQALPKTPREFECLGESAASRIEIMAHKTRPIYGFQFHPERFDDAHPDGRTLIRNVVNHSLET